MADEKRWLGLTADQIEIYLSGGAEPGSIKYEQAKNAQAARLAERGAGDGLPWKIIGAATGILAVVVGVLGLILGGG